MPKRIQRKRIKGWKMPPNTVSVCRPGKFGNPFTVAACIESGYATTKESAKSLCIECFESWLEFGDSSEWFFSSGIDKRKIILDSLHEIRGKDLACFCKEGEPCHGDVLIKIANR